MPFASFSLLRPTAAQCLAGCSSHYNKSIAGVKTDTVTSSTPLVIWVFPKGSKASNVSRRGITVPCRPSVCTRLPASPELAKNSLYGILLICSTPSLLLLKAFRQLHTTHSHKTTPTASQPHKASELLFFSMGKQSRKGRKTGGEEKQEKNQLDKWE